MYGTFGRVVLVVSPPAKPLATIGLDVSLVVCGVWDMWMWGKGDAGVDHRNEENKV